MRTRNFTLMIVGPILVLSSVLSACSTTRKTALDCPPISLNKGNKVSSNHRKAKNNNLFTYNRTKPIKHTNSSTRKNKSKVFDINNSSVTTDKSKVSEIESIEYLSKAEFSKGLIASTHNKLIPSGVPNTVIPSETSERADQQVRCDTIVLKSGLNLIGKVEEIGQTEIKYRKCNNLSGPLIAISKSDVSAILYSNGSHDIITSQNPVQPSNNSSSPGNGETKQIEGFGIAGFAAGVLGLLVAGIPLGIVAIVFGVISIARISKNPNKYKGKGFAIASLILGIVDVVVLLILVASV